MIKAVGRNDPCPCGSGKKFKKCCAQKPAMKKHSFSSIDSSTFSSSLSRITGMASKSFLGNNQEVPTKGLEKKVQQKDSPPQKEDEA